uniref:RING-type domain-containing protein n=1 Tax=Chromera velia CCMP2878 TaxID=1169474 RepID=A0A0G4H9T6_9ALVE|eukprot:Cvel_25474.t1-p1 / transcript=Cvel_25474.t1 / gene=Cvel_25474 / organism=Chromera_velia_CCMP2878 / gene_product=Probable E3 ubiquitin-protein ligase MYCBP2, putative / transcript_product=Probable E3 ubiquitin-protein ligase MYCBP2, putative / location=Cvel_scaffold2892:8905-13250(+) / protein_length=930 / sequence_SO=supercontig / SO=protein_coding / is_pseudo=false
MEGSRNSLGGVIDLDMYADSDIDPVEAVRLSELAQKERDEMASPGDAGAERPHMGVGGPRFFTLGGRGVGGNVPPFGGSPSLSSFLASQPQPQPGGTASSGAGAYRPSANVQASGLEREEPVRAGSGRLGVESSEIGRGLGLGLSGIGGREGGSDNAQERGGSRANSSFSLSAPVPAAAGLGSRGGSRDAGQGHSFFMAAGEDEEDGDDDCLVIGYSFHEVVRRERDAAVAAALGLAALDLGGGSGSSSSSSSSSSSAAVVDPGLLAGLSLSGSAGVVSPPAPRPPVRVPPVDSRSGGSLMSDRDGVPPERAQQNAAEALHGGVDVDVDAMGSWGAGGDVDVLDIEMLDPELLREDREAREKSEAAKRDAEMAAALQREEESLSGFVQSQCRFCEGVTHVKGVQQARGLSGGNVMVPAEAPVCCRGECAEKARTHCNRMLPCGHACGGTHGEWEAFEEEKRALQLVRENHVTEEASKAAAVKKHHSKSKRRKKGEKEKQEPAILAKRSPRLNPGWAARQEAIEKEKEQEAAASAAAGSAAPAAAAAGREGNPGGDRKRGREAEGEEDPHANGPCVCVVPSCQAALSRPGFDSDCPVCLDGLHGSPCVALNCGHMVHFGCALLQLQSVDWLTKPQRKPLEFNLLKCPLGCGKLLEHPSLSKAEGSGKLFAVLRECLSDAGQRAKVEGLGNASGDALSDEEALKVYAYYLCHRCNEPYWGGKKECEAAGAPDPPSSSSSSSSAAGAAAPEPPPPAAAVAAAAPSGRGGRRGRRREVQGEAAAGQAQRERAMKNMIGRRSARGGQAAAAAEDAARRGVKEDDRLLCPACVSIVTGVPSNECSIHGTKYMNFKCKYCCGTGAWFCFGHTHFCDPCHKRVMTEGSGAYQTLVKQCPGQDSSGRVVDVTKCPLGIPHGKNPCERSLGCTLCLAAKK